MQILLLPDLSCRRGNIDIPSSVISSAPTISATVETIKKSVMTTGTEHFSFQQ